MKTTELNLRPIKDLFRKIFSYKNSVRSFLRANKHKLSNIIDTNYQLGLFHLNAGNINDAEFRFRFVLYFEPEHYESLYNLAKCLMIKKRKESAIKKLKKALELNKNFVEAQYLLSLVDSQYVTDTVPLSIIKDYYNDSAKDFDKKFSSRNGYKVPEYMAETLSQHLDPQDHYTVLDIGCGTGGCSNALSKKIHIKFLIGIDISKNMLEEAQKIQKDGTSLFDQLVNIDYAEFLRKNNNTYNIIIAGLSLHFDKNLQENLTLISGKLNKGGYLVFSVEKSHDNNPSNFNTTYANFCYNEHYIKNSIKNSKLVLSELDQVTIDTGKTALIAICKK